VNKSPSKKVCAKPAFLTLKERKEKGRKNSAAILDMPTSIANFRSKERGQDHSRRGGGEKGGFPKPLDQSLKPNISVRPLRDKGRGRGKKEKRKKGKGKRGGYLPFVWREALPFLVRRVLSKKGEKKGKRKRSPPIFKSIRGHF